MLGKLIKYEFRNTAKVMLILYLFTAAVTAFGSVVLSSTARAALEMS